MNSSINLNELWKKQSAAQPGMEALLAKWKKIKRANLRRIWITNILFSLTSLFIIWIWIGYNPQEFTTKTGIVLVILAMAIYGLAFNKLKPILKDIDNSTNNKDYLEKLLTLKSRQQFLNTTMMNLYFIMLSSGLFLYMIEPTAPMSFQGRLLTYAITATWVCFNWFYVRPKMIRKQEGKIDSVISKVKEIVREME
jgi:hypothetical protein